MFTQGPPRGPSRAGWGRGAPLRSKTIPASPQWAHRIGGLAAAARPAASGPRGLAAKQCRENRRAARRRARVAGRPLTQGQGPAGGPSGFGVAVIPASIDASPRAAMGKGKRRGGGAGAGLVPSTNPV